ncbi:MAG: hypothetical protein L6R41_004595 [Letrouitia leprolyta]|nr:MAG: hypothetical protein L6R41_004595 [Letrouitia leprolyta]
MLRRDPTLVHESQTQRQRSPQHGEDLLPIIKGGNHWVLAHVNPQTKTIENFDSFHGSAHRAHENAHETFKVILCPWFSSRLKIKRSTSYSHTARAALYNKSFLQPASREVIPVSIRRDARGVHFSSSDES